MLLFPLIGVDKVLDEVLALVVAVGGCGGMGGVVLLLRVVLLGVWWLVGVPGLEVCWFDGVECLDCILVHVWEVGGVWGDFVCCGFELYLCVSVLEQVKEW